jgi:hypothetical protein
MADKNVLSLSFNDSETTNYEATALFVSDVAPRNINNNANIPRGDVVFEFNTPKDTFCDLFKTYMSMQYRIVGPAPVGNNPAAPVNVYWHNDTILPCMFSRAEVFVNGVKISSSNNYTQDGVLSRRLQFGADYNKSVNGIYAIPSIADAATDVSPAGSYTAIDTMDSFWLRQSEGLILPPETNVRMVFTIDDSYKAKAAIKPAAAAAAGDIQIDSFSLRPCFYVNPSEVKKSYRLRFISLNSFKSTISDGDTQTTMQYTVAPTVMKVALVHQPVGYDAMDATAKLSAAFLFNSPLQVTTCQMKNGNVVFPQTPYSMTYGWRAIYQDYINHSQQIAKDAGKEPYQYWCGTAAADDRNNWGPIILAPLVKDRMDPSNTLEVRESFTPPAAAQYCILTAFEEQLIEVGETSEGAITTVPTI